MYCKVDNTETDRNFLDIVQVAGKQAQWLFPISAVFAFRARQMTAAPQALMPFVTCSMVT